MLIRLSNNWSFPTMFAAMGILFLLIGPVLIVTREWSAQFHERWNAKFRWTQWATGPKAMEASRIANVVVGIACMAIGVAFFAVAFVAD
jgi:ABC-type multidrug transport system permease subunit